MPEDSAGLLAEAGLVDAGALERARGEAAREGGTIPEHLVYDRAVDDELITEFFRTRLLVQRLPPQELMNISQEVIGSIPRQMAIEYRAVPISRDDDGNLTVALSNPADTHAVQEISYQAEAYVIRAVVTQLQLAWCLGHYYGFASRLGETLMVQPEAEHRGNTQQMPAVGEVQARRESRMIPRSGLEALPNVVVEPEEAEDGPSIRRLQQLSPADLRSAASGLSRASGDPVDTARTQKFRSPWATDEDSSETTGIPHPDEGECHLHRRASRTTAVGIARASSSPSIVIGPDGETRPTNLPYTGDDGDAVAEDQGEEERTVPVSSKRKRKKRKSKASTSPEAPMQSQSRSMPLSTLASSEVDDGWGDADFDLPPHLAVTTTEGTAEAAEAPPAAEAAAEPAEAAPTNGSRARAKRITTLPSESEDDTERLTHTVKELGHTDDRNAVFDLLMEYLAGTHERVAFFAVKKGKVCAWKHKGLDSGDSGAEVLLEESSTFHNVVQTQLPFHGGELDPAAQDFLTKATGNAPEDIIAAPVAIGPRVIGVLYGDAPHGTLFDQQVAMVTRSAGLALQRILQNAKK